MTVVMVAYTFSAVSTVPTPGRRGPPVESLFGRLSKGAVGPKPDDAWQCNSPCQRFSDSNESR